MTIRWIPLLLLAFALGLGMGNPVSAKVLWSVPGWHDLHQTNRILSLKGSDLSAQDDASEETLYLRFTVDPLSDGVSEMTSHYFAGCVFAEKGSETLGLGNALNAWGYSAFNADKKGSANDADGEVDFNSLNSETLGHSKFEPPRIGTPRTIAAKIQFVPGDADQITVWMDPDLSAGSDESRLLPEQTTVFRANASFDEFQLVHQGGGRGWRIGNLKVATTFKGLTERNLFQKPIFWRWVVATLICGWGGVGWYRTSHRERLFQRERDELESRNALERERTRIARDLHDSLGAALSEISLMSSIAQTTGDPVQGLRKIESRAKDSIEELETIVWATDPKADTVHSFADHATRFATDFLASAGIKALVTIPPGILPGKMQANTRHHAFLAFKEAIHNVVKHARASEVRIGFEPSVPRLAVTIADNGRGNCPEENACGPDGSQCHGLRNIRSRLESIGGTASIESHPDCGTKVRFEIPL